MALTVVLACGACRSKVSTDRRSDGDPAADPAPAPSPEPGPAPAPAPSPGGEPLVFRSDDVTVTIPQDVFGPKVDLVIGDVRDTSVFVDPNATTVSTPQAITVKKDGVVVQEPSPDKTYEVALAAPATKMDGTPVDPEKIVVQLVIIGSDGLETKLVLSGADVIVSTAADGRLVATTALRFPRVELAVAEAATVPPITPNKPNAAFTVNSGAAFTSSRGTTLTLSNPSRVAEARSGDGTCDGAMWRSYTGPIPHTLAAGADGSRTICLEVRDVQGAVSAATGSIALDATAPAVPGSLKTSDDSAGGAQTSSADDTEVFFSWAASTDAGAGVRDYSLARFPAASCGGVATVTNGITQTSVSHTGSDGDTYSFRVTAYDAVGNASESVCSPAITITLPAASRVIHRSRTTAATAGTTASTVIDLDSGDGVTAGDRLVLAYALPASTQNSTRTSLTRNGTELFGTLTGYAAVAGRTFPHVLWGVVEGGAGSDVYELRHRSDPADTTNMDRAHIASISLDGLTKDVEWIYDEGSDVVSPSGSGSLLNASVPGFQSGKNWIFMARLVLECQNNGSGLKFTFLDPFAVIQEAKVDCPSALAAGNALIPVVMFFRTEFSTNTATTVSLQFDNVVGTPFAVRKIAIFGMRDETLGASEFSKSGNVLETIGSFNTATMAVTAATSGQQFLLMTSGSANVSGGNYKLGTELRANGSVVESGGDFVADASGYGPFSIMAPYTAATTGALTGALFFKRGDSGTATMHGSSILILPVP